MIIKYFLHISWIPAIYSSLPFPKDVNCNGPVPKVTDGKYVFHANQSYELKLTTQVELSLDLHHRSCFQVEIENGDQKDVGFDGDDNETRTDSDSKTSVEGGEERYAKHVSSVFYVVSYERYEEDYPINNGFRFGIPEFRSYCKCDCPKSDSFCHERFGGKYCTKGEICVQKYHANIQSYGCEAEGAANLCCEVSVKPYNDWRFRAVVFGNPRAKAVLKIDIYVYYDKEWTLFRHKTREISPSGRNRMKINGHENVANLNIRTHSSQAKFQLSHDGNTNYYYLENSPSFRLLRSPVLNPSFAANNYGFLIYRHSRWTVPNAQVELPDTHRPNVINCQAQKYTDGYKTVTPVQVIRNSSGSISHSPSLGKAVDDANHVHVEKIELGPGVDSRSDGGNVIVHHAPESAPTLNLQISLEQRLNIVAHLHLSHLAGFIAKICRDKHLNRFLNITLINAYGEFGIDIFNGPGARNLDVTLSVVTRLPLSSNYSEYRPLPGHVTSERYVCVYPAQRPNRRHCKVANYIEEPVMWYVLPNTFIETKGNCPGCNALMKKSFFAYLNPRTWFDGIGTVSEGVAIAVEVCFYALIALISLALFRRVIWPILRWALCPTRGPTYVKAKEEVGV